MSKQFVFVVSIHEGIKSHKGLLDGYIKCYKLSVRAEMIIYKKIRMADVNSFVYMHRMRGNPMSFNS